MIWTSQPPFGTPINKSHPWAIGLKMFWAFWGGLPFEILNGNRPSANANFTTAQTPYGLAGVGNSSTHTNLTYSNLPPVGPAMSVAGSCFFTSNSAGVMIERELVNATWMVLYEPGLPVLEWRGGGASNRCAIGIGISNVWTTWCFTDNGAGTSNASNSSGYYNGIGPNNAGGSASTAPISNNNPIHLFNYDTSNYWLPGNQLWIGVWNYTLPAPMAIAITRSPGAIWQMFQAPQVPYYKVAAAPIGGLVYPTFVSQEFPLMWQEQ